MVSVVFSYLKFWHVARGAFYVLLAHKEEQIVRVDAVHWLRLEKEVAHEQVRPVGGALKHHKSTICKRGKICI